MLDHALAAAGAPPDLIVDDARAMLLRAARGLPRLISHLLRLALVLADEREQPRIDASIMNSAIIPRATPAPASDAPRRRHCAYRLRRALRQRMHIKGVHWIGAGSGAVALDPAVPVCSTWTSLSPVRTLFLGRADRRLGSLRRTQPPRRHPGARRRRPPPRTAAARHSNAITVLPDWLTCKAATARSVTATAPEIWWDRARRGRRGPVRPRHGRPRAPCHARRATAVTESKGAHLDCVIFLSPC
jgi:hypothetical protein